jgi:acetyltransferase-like isoleucine patch superfamily enzyme
MLPSLHQTVADRREGVLSRLLTKVYSAWVQATYPFARKGIDLSIHFSSEISRALAPHISLGNRVAIGKHTWFHTWIGPNEQDQVKIVLEDGCDIGPRCTITAANRIHFDGDVVLSSDVLVMDHAHAYEDVSKPISDQGATNGGRIRIGKGCRIGRGAAILCNRGELVLGQNCVVAPGAVVGRSFPPGSVLVGNPARAVRKSGTKQPAKIEALTSRHERRSTGELVRNGISSGKGTPSVGLVRVMSEDPLTWFSRLAGKFRTLWMAKTYPFASFAKGAWLHYSCHVTRLAAPYISIGEKVGLGRDARLDVSPTPGIGPPLLILDSGMQRRCVISARNSIRVMRNVMFGPSVLVADHVCQEDGPMSREQKTPCGKILIEEGCWIGFGTIIVCEQGELIIGKNSVVGANSVVTRSIPPYSVVAGDPAIIVKQYDFSAQKWVLGCIRSTDGSRNDLEPVGVISPRKI